MNTAIRKGLGRASNLTTSPYLPTTSAAQCIGQGFVWAVDAGEGVSQAQVDTCSISHSRQSLAAIKQN